MIIYLEQMVFISEYDLPNSPVYLNHDLGSRHSIGYSYLLSMPQLSNFPSQSLYLVIHVIPEKKMLPITWEVTSDLG